MGPIGVFDSGYGGLTILREIRKLMPQYDYLYLGDNARAPYGTRSYDVVYEFTLQAVRFLFEQGCHLVILACNTASAKALRSIQQNDLPRLDPQRRGLGVIRPTVEIVVDISKSRHVGIMATPGTIRSRTYELELAKQSPDIKVTGEACPMWVPLVENEEYDSPGADYFVRERIENLLRRDPLMRHPRLHTLPPTAWQDTPVHASRREHHRARLLRGAEPARLSPSPSRNGRTHYPRRLGSLPDNRASGNLPAESHRLHGRTPRSRTRPTITMNFEL